MFYILIELNKHYFPCFYYNASKKASKKTL